MIFKNKYITLFFVLVMIFTCSSFVSGENMDIDYIKIGLKKTVNSDKVITLESDSFKIGYFDKEFNLLFYIDKDIILARPDDYYFNENDNYQKVMDPNMAQIGPFHIEIDLELNNYKEVVDEIDNLKQLNITAYPAYINGEYKIWIGQYINEKSAIDDTVKLSNNIDKELRIVKDNKNRIVLEDKNRQTILIFDSLDNIVLSGNEDKNVSLISVGKNRYRDYISFNLSQTEFIAINFVEIDHYLYGVVPREMSASWPLEALKAQAVAARNYTMLGVNKHINMGYDLCDTQDCQVYGGYDWENIKSNTAVDETSENLLMYQGELVNTFYHSTSGGHTENSENIWSNTVSYLRGVEDEFSLGSPNDKWQLLMSKEEIALKLLDNGIDIGEVLSVEVQDVSEYGRVLELMIKGTKEDIILEKEKSRYIFGTSSLKSTWFDVKADSEVFVMDSESRTPIKTSIADYNIITSNGKVSNENNKIFVTDGDKKHEINVNSSQYIFEGKGWGHGLGMSQWGAKGMAELGYSYKEILEYYYTGAIVK